jgi:hypothetical protein
VEVGMETVAVPAGSPAVPSTAPAASAVGWGAIVAGAVAAITASIVLLTLGAGLGLTAASPWSGEGPSAKAIGVAAVVWLVIVQWLSAALGGFLTGRLRVRWSYYNSDEVFFRDTAHGFLSWAVAIAVVAVFASTLTAGVVATAANGAAAGAASKANDSSISYFTDSLYRSDVSGSAMAAAVDGSTPNSNAASVSAPLSDFRSETSHILARGLGSDLGADDRAYLAKMVAARAGLSQDEAQKRVDDVIAKAKAAADAARKAAASLAIATAISLVIGGFIAAVAGGIGGRERDE